MKTYIAIDLKSFYASVECVEMGLDPLNTNLVVADSSRTEKTICLAVSPSLKAYGIPGRARLFEVVQKVNEVNRVRRAKIGNKDFTGESYLSDELNKDKNLKLSYIVATPKMATYEKYGTKIYDIYLRYVAPDDIHVYSVDEVFIDATVYLKNYKLSAQDFTMKLLKDVLKETGITATAGIGTNLYLCKIAMDIVAKKMPADENGVRMAYLDERKYKEELWSHRPLTDFWRVGVGYQKKLEQNRLYTMGDIARCSIYNEDKLYRLFGVNAELLIDHAWGYEPCTMQEIKSYRPLTNSLSTGQVLTMPYDAEKTKLIIKEMTELLCLDLVDKGLETNQIVLHIGYDIENLTDKKRREKYNGEITVDRYGREVPKHAHGSVNLKRYTSSTRIIQKATEELLDRILDKELLTRRMSVTANNILPENSDDKPKTEQVDMFLSESERAREENEIKKEKNLQKASIEIKKKFGKNALLKGMNLQEGATTKERNKQIGGHKA